MSNLFDLSGKVALVTGASRGLGAAMASALADAGAQVARHASAQPASEDRFVRRPISPIVRRPIVSCPTCFRRSAGSTFS